PAGYKVPPHNHPKDEYVTVISGNFHVGMGDKLDDKKVIELTAGGYVEAPASRLHERQVSAARARPPSACSGRNVSYAELLRQPVLRTGTAVPACAWFRDGRAQLQTWRV